MNKERRNFTPKEKVKILRLHLIEKKPVSEICEKYQIHPNSFYRWQKEFFENGEAAFEHQPKGPERKLQRRINHLEERVSNKDEVIAEIMEAQVKLKKNLASIDVLLGRA